MLETAKKLSFPVVVRLKELEQALTQPSKETGTQASFEGMGLSPGIVFGQVRVVQNIPPETNEQAATPHPPFANKVSSVVPCLRGKPYRFKRAIASVD